MKKITLTNIIIYIFSILLSFSTIASLNIVYDGNIFSTLKDTYMKSINIYEWILMIILSIIIYLLINYLSTKIDKVNLKSKKNISTKILFITSFILILLAWIPYYLSYYPGCIYYDGLDSIKQVLTSSYGNHHPIFYTLYVGIFVKLGELINNMSLGIFIYTLIQSILMISVLSYFIIWLNKHEINKKYIYACIILFMFFPLFPFYAITLWKDTIFSLSLFMLTLELIDFSINKELLKKNKSIIVFILTSLVMCFTRNNGIYILIFIIVVFILTNIKKFKVNIKFNISLIITVLGIIIIQGPLYSSVGLNGYYSEKIGIPIQQIAYVISDNGNISTKEKEYINNIWDIDEIKEKYTPLTVDTLKFYLNKINTPYIEEHKSEFFKTWLNVAKKNPNGVAKAYLLETLGYWSPIHSSDITLIQSGIWQNDYGITDKDILKSTFKFSIRNILEPKVKANTGIIFWIIIFISLIILKRYGMKKIIYITPILGLWITLMIASPIAFQIRYVYIYYLTLPILPILPSIFKDEKVKKKDIKI